MPSESPLRPKLLKGALVVYDDPTPGSPGRVLPFQYNPEKLTREFERREVEDKKKKKGKGGAQEDVLRVEGPPKESLDLEVQLHAADFLEDPVAHPGVVEHGLLPALATLEMLLYPSSFRVLENEQLAKAGKVQLSAADLPLTLLVLGKRRSFPVLVQSLSITEEAFDQELNPIQAKVSLAMQVLSYVELAEKNLGRDAYVAYQKHKEELARDHQVDGDDVRAASQYLPAEGA